MKPVFVRYFVVVENEAEMLSVERQRNNRRRITSTSCILVLVMLIVGETGVLQTKIVGREEKCNISV